jgi:hypothetical protein
MDLDELAVGVEGALLVERGLGGAGADDGVGGLAEDGSVAAGADDDGVGGEGAGLHAAEVHGADAAADAFGVEDGGEELPAFVLGDFAFGLVAADLLVEGVEELLAGGGSGEGGAVEEGAAEAAEVEEAFGGAVEGDAHAVEEVDDGGALVAHGLDGGLVGEEVAAVDGVVEVLEDESPSPLRFLAALMPPWAQTEWERLTGTMEKRSTVPPASAILMTAERPARPPPTTMMRGVAAMGRAGRRRGRWRIWGCRRRRRCWRGP